MKAITTAVLLTMGLSVAALAADYKGFVEDTMCSKMAAMKGNSECAQTCIKGGSPAVLVTPDGTIYKIANQDKIVAFAGKSVTVSGDLKGDTITVASVK